MKFASLVGAVALGVFCGITLCVLVWVPIFGATFSTDPHELTDPCREHGGVAQIETSPLVFAYGSVILCKDGTAQEIHE